MKGRVLKFLICLIVLLFVDSFVLGIEYDSTINKFLDTAKEYSKEIFPELGNENILEAMMEGEAFKGEKITENER